MSVHIVVPTRVYLDHWTHPIYGDRWSLWSEDRWLATRGTEFEIRQYARDMGWIVEPTTAPVPEA